MIGTNQIGIVGSGCKCELKLGMGELKPTSMTLQLVDRSVKRPKGIISDVLIKVDKFYFHVDIIVTDTELVHNVWSQILVILG